MIYRESTNKSGLFIALCLQKLCLFAFCGPCYAICNVVLFCLSLYKDSKARNQGNTSINIVLVLNIAYFSVGNLRIAKNGRLIVDR